MYQVEEINGNWFLLCFAAAGIGWVFPASKHSNYALEGE